MQFRIRCADMIGTIGQCISAKPGLASGCFLLQVSRNAFLLKPMEHHKGTTLADLLYWWVFVFGLRRGKRHPASKRPVSWQDTATYVRSFGAIRENCTEAGIPAFTNLGSCRFPPQPYAYGRFPYGRSRYDTFQQTTAFLRDLSSRTRFVFLHVLCEQ